MRFLSIFLFSIFLFSCSSESDKETTTKTPAQERAELLEKLQSEKPPVPVKKADNLQQLLDQIWDLSKVQERAEYVKKQTDGARTLKTRVVQKPTKEDPSYWVKVGEDNGDNFVSHFQFSIDYRTKKIFYYDELSGEKIAVEEWVKKEE